MAGYVHQCANHIRTPQRIMALRLQRERHLVEEPTPLCEQRLRKDLFTVVPTWQDMVLATVRANAADGKRGCESLGENVAHGRLHVLLREAGVAHRMVQRVEAAQALTLVLEVWRRG